MQEEQRADCEKLHDLACVRMELSFGFHAQIQGGGDSRHFAVENSLSRDFRSRLEHRFLNHPIFQRTALKTPCSGNVVS